MFRHIIFFLIPGTQCIDPPVPDPSRHVALSAAAPAAVDIGSSAPYVCVGELPAADDHTKAEDDLPCAAGNEWVGEPGACVESGSQN